MRPPANRRVVVVGYDCSTALGHGLERTWQRAAQGQSGIRHITRYDTQGYAVNVAGEIPDYHPLEYDFIDAKELKFWNAHFVAMTMVMSQAALVDAGIEVDDSNRDDIGCLVGSAINGCDAYEQAVRAYDAGGPLKVSPMLLPNVCANLPAGKASMLLGFRGPTYAPGAACATGNFCIAEAAWLIQSGRVPVMLAGGVEFPIIAPIVCGFGNMNAAIKSRKDRSNEDPAQASRPYSVDRRGFVLAEGCGIMALTSLEYARAHGLQPRAEILGVGFSSDAYHFTKPNRNTIIQALNMAIDDAGLKPADIQHVNGHGTSTPSGDACEVECLRAVFGEHLERIPVTSNKSQIGHSLGATAAVEDILAIESMRRSAILPTINYQPDPELSDVDVVGNELRRYEHEIVLSNAFGFGGTNCCLVIRGMP